LPLILFSSLISFSNAFQYPWVWKADILSDHKSNSLFLFPCNSGSYCGLQPNLVLLCKLVIWWIGKWFFLNTRKPTLFWTEHLRFPQNSHVEILIS
jgi:hypothetical protein